MHFYLKNFIFIFPIFLNFTQLSFAAPKDCKSIFKSNCYQLEKSTLMSYKDASATCKKQGGILAGTLDGRTVEFLIKFFTQSSSRTTIFDQRYSQYWFGLEKFSNGNWTFENGQLCEGSGFWQICNSNFQLLNYNCAVLDENIYKLILSPCDTPRPFICQFPVGCAEKDLSIPFGNYNKNFENGIAPRNSKLDIKCDEDYFLSGPNSVICKSDDSWSEKPKCVFEGCVLKSGLIPNSTLEKVEILKKHESVAVKCEIGHLEGPESVKCLGNGTLSKIPKCIYGCSLRKVDKNGEIDFLSSGKSLLKIMSSFPYVLPDHYKLKCKDGYEPSSNDHKRCQENLTWSSVPKCELACPEDEIREGMIMTISDRKIGGKAKISCTEFHVLIGNGIIKCQSNGQWSNDSTCVRGCSKHDVYVPFRNPENVSMVVKPGEKFFVECPLGFVLIGDDNVICEESGQWSENPKCLPGCSTKDVNILHSDEDYKKFFTFVKYGTKFSIKCNDGFRLDGPDEIFCNSTGFWSEVPTCRKIPQCNLADVTTKNAVLNRTEIVKQDEIVNIICEKSFTLIGPTFVQCLKDGTWTEAPLCVLGCNPTLIDIENSLITFDKTKVFDINSYVDVRCVPGHVLLGPDRINCQSNRTWTPFPECVPGCSMEELKIENGHYFEKYQTVAPYFSTVEIKCNLTFKLIGDNVVTCLENGHWSKRPSCRSECLLYKRRNVNPLSSGKEIYCVSGEIKKNLQSCVLQEGDYCKPLCNFQNLQTKKKFNNVFAAFNTQLTIQCPSGHFQLGTPTLRCQADGNWSKPTGHCVNLCNLHHVPVSGPSVLLEGEDIAVQCQNDYQLFGSNSLDCMNTTKWNAELNCNPVCKVNESFLFKYNYRSDNKTLVIPYNKYVNVKCRKGYKSYGQSPSVKCNAFGELIAYPPCFKELNKISNSLATLNEEVKTNSQERQFVFPGICVSFFTFTFSYLSNLYFQI